MTTLHSTVCSRVLVCLATVTSLVAACDSPDDGSAVPAGAEIMQNTVHNTIVPDIAAFRQAAETMHDDVDAFCGAPAPEALGGLQDRWRSLSTSWNAIAAYNLGPLDDDIITPKIIFIESMRQRGTDYTQTVRDAAALAIASGDPLDEAYFDGRTFDEVGLLALEVLVFEDSREGNSTELADIVGDFETQPRKCGYLRGIASMLSRCAAEVDDGWNLAFGDSGEAFKDTMVGDELPDGSQPVVALLIALQEHLNYLKVRKLEGLPDAQLSGHFYPNIAAGLRALEHLLVQPSPEDSFGLLDRIEAIGFEAEVGQVKANLTAAIAAADAEDSDALIAAISLLEGNLKREIPDGLGVKLGITFTDGD